MSIPSGLFFLLLRILKDKGGLKSMQNVNSCIGCNVSDCKFNVEGKNCSLSHIHVGCGCSAEQCTCCDSFENKH